MSKEKTNIRKIFIAIPVAIIIGFIGMFGAGCSTEPADSATYESAAKEDVADVSAQVESKDVASPENNPGGEANSGAAANSGADANPGAAADSDTAANPGAAAGKNTEIIIPEYKGSSYTVINNNQPGFTDEEKSNTSPFETYSNLDSKGRCGVAFANICREIMPTEKRGEIGMIKPSGWHTVKYNDLIDGNYLYNRCHLIGYQLAGENANEKNLITGTRHLNVEGMLPFENKVANYVESGGKSRTLQGDAYI